MTKEYFENQLQTLIKKVANGELMPRQIKERKDELWEIAFGCGFDAATNEDNPGKALREIHSLDLSKAGEHLDERR